MVRPKYIEEVRKLAKVYRIPISFEHIKYAGGAHRCGKIRLDISRNVSRSYFLSAFFHELGHAHCYRNGIWKTYHFPRNKIKPRNANTIIRIGLKVERWVDYWGAQEMKKWYPRMKFYNGYNGPIGRKWFHENVLPQFRS